MEQNWLRLTADGAYRVSATMELAFGANTATDSGDPTRGSPSDSTQASEQADKTKEILITINLQH
ncbi:hypothetical protein GF1_23700 [Desulfolithobacter dissulfuricans]|uniref:Uncharacterized protein n=2 Tax=Desulfolithobacter dissulfuricans TaxID=2795293 RepID=A0A915XIM7_9BACT|nr:hypothetical protein GF1_23700 [Desulfolithobacter dissulfuricans]